MSDLKPGEFVGADGKVYAVWVASIRERESDGAVFSSEIKPTHPDFCAAVEALRALVPEPFEWEPTGMRLRRFHGGVVQVYDYHTTAWSPAPTCEQDAFNAALRYVKERGHADE